MNTIIVNDTGLSNDEVHVKFVYGTVIWESVNEFYIQFLDRAKPPAFAKNFSRSFEYGGVYNYICGIKTLTGIRYFNGSIVCDFNN